MKILQLCSKIPFPPTDGGTQAMHVLTEGLIKAENDVTVMAIKTHKHNTPTEEIDADYRKKTNYQSVFIDTRVKPLQAFANLFSSKSYNISRFFSASFEGELKKLLKANKFDIVHLETLYATPYLATIRKHSNAKIVLRSQNVEFMIWKRMAKAVSNPLKRWYFNLLALRLKNYELQMLNRYDAIICITQADANVFKSMGCNVPTLSFPFGININDYRTATNSPEVNTVFHLGAMNWMPNEEGVKWLINDVWPVVQKQNTNLKLHLAGRHMPAWLKNLNATNIIIDGEVADAHGYIHSKNLMIVPLLSGGGMRIKIIEGMAMGKTIIATTIAAEGIEYTNNHDILIADTPQQFADAVTQLLNDNEHCKTVGKNARELAATKYSNADICNRLSQFYSQLINNK
jgi:glycosyltransferase involved in cell wall biosynthesis